MSREVRVRFAPSPTGYLHIGGARTALFNYLFATHNKGVFILRIEDTDRSRSTDEFIDAILDGMSWLGLAFDEGPYRQTDRSEVYKKYLNKLIDSGKAYYCYCSAEELEERRKKALTEGGSIKYDGRCRNLTSPPPDRPPTVRFEMPRTGETVINDLIKGSVSFDNETLDDFIIMRSDGTFTYNFVVVADDMDMGITHIIRGDDHLNNTPKQIHMYKALGGESPEFAHLPMIMGSDKSRLSKRHGATSVQAYRDLGYLPESLINYLARLGWSSGDQEVFSKDELIEKFSLQNVGKSAAVFNPEKLLWLNSEYIKDCNSDKLSSLVLPFLKSEGVAPPDYSPDKEWLSKSVSTLRERSKTLIELADSMSYYIKEEIEMDEKAKKKFINEKTVRYLTDVHEGLSGLAEFSEKSLEELFLSIMEKNDVKLGKIAQPVRVALTGNTASPGIFEVIEIIGKERALKRLKKAIESI